MSLMRPGINWVGSGSALSCFLATVWRNSWVLRLVRSVLVLEYHFHPCIFSASIFFLDCPYRVVHPEFWFCNLPVGGWSVYSKNTNSCSCSSPCRCTFALLRFSKRECRSSVFLCCQSVKLFIHFLSYLVTERGPSNRCHQYEEHVLFVSNQIYYWVYKCTTSHYYTNIIKTI